MLFAFYCSIVCVPWGSPFGSGLGLFGFGFLVHPGRGGPDLVSIKYVNTVVLHVCLELGCVVES